MKKPIEWHEKFVKSRELYYEDKRRLAIQDLADCDSGDAENAFLRHQIYEARRRGVTGYDREKFLRPKRDKEKS